MQAGVLTVKLLYAVDLKDGDWFGKQDPYCKLTVGGRTLRSKTHKGGGKNPVWNETFRFNIIGDNTLNIEVFDEDMLKDDLLGRAVVDLASVRATKSAHQTAHVTRPKGGKQAGQLFLDLEFEPQGASVPMPDKAPVPYQPTPAPAPVPYAATGYPAPSGQPAPAGYPAAYGAPPSGYPAHGSTPAYPSGGSYGAPPAAHSASTYGHGAPPPGYPSGGSYGQAPAGYPPAGYPPAGYPPAPGYGAPPPGYPQGGYGAPPPQVVYQQTGHGRGRGRGMGGLGAGAMGLGAGLLGGLFVADMMDGDLFDAGF